MKMQAALILMLFHQVLFCQSIYNSLKRLNIDTIDKPQTLSYAERPIEKLSTSTPGTVASRNFDVHFYQCEWEVDPAINYIRGKVTAHFTTSLPSASLVFDFSPALTVDSVIYHKANIQYKRVPGDGLEVALPSPLAPATKDSVTICYQGEPRQFGFGAFTKSFHNGVPVISTLSEPYGAKEWWPCKNGLDDKADSIDIIITNPVLYSASTNGIKVSETTTGNKTTSYWKHRYPIASYLVALAVTDYVVLKDSVLLGNRMMPVIDYVYPESQNEFRQLVPYTKQALQFFSGLFGNYPFLNEKYGHTQFNWGGGMEHQTNTFMSRPIISLMAHELAHQWFGNKVTCGSWRDLWLNEGFASYLQALYDETLTPGYLVQSRKNLINSITSRADGSVWVNDTSQDSRLFDNRLTYLKGSFLLHMLRWKLGDSTFLQGCRRYLSDPRLSYKFATTADLQRNMKEVSGQNLSLFFRQWYFGEGYPSYTVQWVQDSVNVTHVSLSQVTSHPSVPFYEMPVPVLFRNVTRDTTIIFDNRKNAESFLVDIGFKADTAIFDPSFQILSKNNITLKAGCNAAAIREKLPFYQIEWKQNANNWIHLSVKQSNTNADPVAEKIPLHILFSGNGGDTLITIKDVRYTMESWINPRFKTEKVAVSSPSCFLANAYAITRLEGNAAENEIRVFPNPAVDYVTVSIINTTEKSLVFELYNAAGQLVHKQNLLTAGPDGLVRIPVGRLAKGVYLLHVKSSTRKLLTKKIVK